MTTMRLPVGTLITCEAGHRICETAEVIESHEDPKKNHCRPSYFDNFEPGQYRPKDGDSDLSLFFCQHCGMPWIDTRPAVGGGLVTKLHTEKGW